MNLNNKRKRMSNPMDALAKRQAAYAADVRHEYFGFPGKYFGPCPNEYPNSDGSVPRVDSSYFIELDGKLQIMNAEDESYNVDNRSYKKLNGYRINLEYAFNLPVNSAITTDAELDKCKQVLECSETLTLKPIIRSYPQLNGEKRLCNIRNKIKNKQVLTNVEAMDLIMIPRMFKKNQDQVLEEVCSLLSELKIEDKNFGIELVFEMRCVIHKYAKTIDDIERLEGVIKLNHAMTAMEYQHNKLIDKGRNEGLIQGRTEGLIQGKFSMALKVKELIGIDEAMKISGFSKEELESGKLNETKE